MARQPEVFVRALGPVEAPRLVKITRTARDRVRLRRAGSVLASVQGRSAAEAAAMFAASPQYAREVIHTFTEKGFAALTQNGAGTDPVGSVPSRAELVCRVPKTPPRQVGCPFTTWSLSKLGEHLTARHRVVISTETVRTIPRDAGISWQATRTWKASKDPEFVAKMARILQLYDRALADGRVICVDECQQRHRRMPRVMAAGWHPPMVVIRPTVNPSGARSLLSRSTVCRATHGPAPATAVVVAVAEGSWQAAGRGRGPGR